jgi:hypothetical protein
MLKLLRGAPPALPVAHPRNNSLKEHARNWFSRMVGVQ